jgi:hypothetical protein
VIVLDIVQNVRLAGEASKILTARKAGLCRKVDFRHSGSVHVLNLQAGCIGCTLRWDGEFAPRRQFVRKPGLCRSSAS